MTGSVRLRRPGVWELRIYLGRDEGGRIRHRHLTIQGTRRTAERELARLVAEQDRQAAAVPDEITRPWGPTTTVNDTIAGWRDNGWQDLSPSTVRGYEGVWRRHVQDAIGRRRIATLTTYEVERYFRDLKAKGVGRTTVRLTRALLHRSCRLARKWSGNTLPNPVNGAELPLWRPHERRADVRAPEIAEVRALLDTARFADPRVAALIRVVAATGMRRGEACALRWDDLDPEGGTIRVDEGVVSVDGTAAAREPKTRASVRLVAVDQDTLAMLTGLHHAQEKLATACELELMSAAFVFSFEPGGTKPPHPDTMSHAFAKVRDAADVASDVHLHSLRHFHATALDPVISEAQKQTRLGWATVQMARHYTDAVPQEDRRAAEHVGRILSPGAGRGAPHAEQVSTTGAASASS
ncbi:MAG: tyrosine-type recombinase/integrase [Acidimicrobiales bacterium]